MSQEVRRERNWADLVTEHGGWWVESGGGRKTVQCRGKDVYDGKESNWVDTVLQYSGVTVGGVRQRRRGRGFAISHHPGAERRFPSKFQLDLIFLTKFHVALPVAAGALF